MQFISGLDSKKEIVFVCRLVCLRVHPTFCLLNPTETFVTFTSIDGFKHEIWPDSGEQTLQGNLLPNGKLLNLAFDLFASLPSQLSFPPEINEAHYWTALVLLPIAWHFM